MPEVGESTELTDDLFDAPVVETSLVFEGRIWNVRRDVVSYGEGTFSRDYVDHTGAVAVLAMDDDGRILLIKQYRHPIRAREWEIPAGLLDIAGEPALLAAQRELAEETDYAATRWHVLADLATSAGGSNEVVRVFLARGISTVVTDFDRTEEEADLERRWVSLDDAVDAVLARRVTNSILEVAVLVAFAQRSRGWAGLADGDAPWPRHPHIR